MAGPRVAQPVPVAPQGAIGENQPRFWWGGGAYNWWVRAWGPDGMGPWSGPMTFNMPFAVGTWNRVYVNREDVNVIDEWTQAGEWVLDNPLEPGNYAWWLGVWDAGGGRVIWSDRTDFAVGGDR